MSTLYSSPSTLHQVRGAWLAIALSPLVLVLAVGVAFVLDGSAASTLGGALLAVLTLVAPTVAILEAHAADREHEHGASAALTAGVVDWLLVVIVLTLAVVSPVAALVGIVVSGIVVLTTWGDAA